MFFLRPDTFIRATSFGFRQQSVPPTDMRAKEELPAVLENRDTEPMDSKSPESNHAKAPDSYPRKSRPATRLVRPRARRVPCVFMARSAHVFVPPSRHSRDKAAGLDGCDAAVTRRRGELIPLPHPKRAIATPCTRRVRRQAMPTKEVLPICRYLKLSIGEIRQKDQFPPAGL